MGIGTHRAIKELDLAAEALQLLEQEYLMDIVARQAIRVGDQDEVDLSGRHFVAQPVKTRPPEDGAAIAVIAKNVLPREGPTFRLEVSLEALKLLIRGLRMSLAQGRHPQIDSYSHRKSPSRQKLTIAGGVERPHPNGVERPDVEAGCVKAAIGVS